MTHLDPSPVQSPAAAAGAMKPSEALRKAREKITPEGAWTQGDAARDIEGNPINHDSASAVCFCAYGAIWHHVPIYTPVADEAEGYLRQTIEDREIDYWNDEPQRTHAEVLDAFDRAADLAEAEGN